MDLFSKVSITSSKLNNLIDATNTYKDTGLMFLGEGTNDKLVIIDVINFGFLSIFPTLSNFLKINVTTLVNCFFLILFFASLIFTLISCFKLCLNKFKILPLFILILTIYFLIFKLILTTSAEYFIYFFWGILPITYYFIDSLDNKIQTIFVIIFSFLIIILGSLLYYSYLSFLVFYYFVIYFNKKKYKKYFYIIPIISVIFLTLFQQYTIKLALNNLNKTEYLNLSSNNQPRNIGNNVYVAFYAGLGYLNSDYFEGYFHDDEIYKLVDKLNNEGGILNNGDYNVTNLTVNDIQLVKEKIIYFIIKEPLFVFKVIFAKVGVLLGYLLVIGNFYLIYFYSSKVEINYKIPLTINLLISSIIPIISIPSKLYSLTFIGASISIFIISYCKNKNFF